MNSAPVEQTKRIVKFTGYHSHLPGLVGAFTRTEGPVLEIGAGVFSTPVLHDLCAAAGRQLVTYEQEGPWADALQKRMSDKTHEWRIVRSYDDMNLVGPWGLALIDRPGTIERLDDARELSLHAGVVVIHAADAPEILRELGVLFKWILWHRHLGLWHTAICSNTVDVTKWNLPTWAASELPPNPLAGGHPVGSIPSPPEAVAEGKKIVQLDDGGYFNGSLNAELRAFAGDGFRNREDKSQQRRTSPMKDAKTGLVLYTGKGLSVSMENHYKGTHAFLVLSGPSSNELNLRGTLEGKRGAAVMCVNNSWSLIRPNMWTAVDDPNTFLDIGWKDPGITKFVPYGLEMKRLGLKMPDGTFRWSGRSVSHMPNVWFYKRNDRFNPDTYLHEDTVNWGCHQNVVDKLGCGGSRSVMLAALRLMYYLGFREVYLVGADFYMDQQKGYAFPQTRERGSIKGNNNTYRDLEIRFKHMQPMFKEAGFNVYNCNPKSHLTAFPHLPYGEALARTVGKFEASGLDTFGWYDAWKRGGKKVAPGVNPDGVYPRAGAQPGPPNGAR